MAKWVRVWDFFTHGHTVRKVGGLNPGRGTIVGGNWQGFLHQTCYIL